MNAICPLAFRHSFFEVNSFYTCKLILMLQASKMLMTHKFGDLWPPSSCSFYLSNFYTHSSIDWPILLQLGFPKLY